MKIVKVNEKVILEECEKCTLSKAYDLLDDIYEQAEDSDIYELAEEAKRAIDKLLKDYYE